MVISVKVIGVGEVDKFLKGLPKKTQKVVGKGIQGWGKNAESNFKLYSTKVGGRKSFFSGDLYQSIKWRRRGLSGFLEMSEAGFALDHMKPHWVALKKGRKITEWAVDKGLAKLGPGGKGITDIYPVTKKSIYVGPHPWIEAGRQKEFKKINRFINRELKKIKEI
jgi:hypothetical protein|tara:strand:+ start:20090 stop:20584 length:495 start_codon:yes stop_codon:yes gene_type:complete